MKKIILLLILILSLITCGKNRDNPYDNQNPDSNVPDLSLSVKSYEFSVDEGNNTVRLDIPSELVLAKDFVVLRITEDEIPNIDNENWYKNPDLAWQSVTEYVKVTISITGITIKDNYNLYNNTYYYKINRKYNASGEIIVGPGAIGGPITVDVTNKPSNLTDLYTVVLGSDKIKLKWTDNATNESGYKIFKSQNPQKPVVADTTLPANSTECIISNLDPGTQYYFWVLAFNPAGASGAESTDAITTAVSQNNAPIISNFDVIGYDNPSGGANIRVYFSANIIELDGRTDISSVKAIVGSDLHNLLYTQDAAVPDEYEYVSGYVSFAKDLNPYTFRIKATDNSGTFSITPINTFYIGDKDDLAATNNNTFQTAEEIHSDEYHITRLNANVSPYKDYYYFNLTSTKDVEIFMYLHPFIDYNITLYNESNVYITDSSVSGNGEMEQITQTLTAGKYYIYVNCPTTASLDKCYTLYYDAE